MPTGPLRLVIMLPQSNRIVTPDAMIRTAEAAEELGFYAVSVRDHISFNGAWISSGMADIDVAGDDRDFFESMQSLSYVAARTQNVKLGVSVIVLPNRHPVLFAKQAATLDVLSGGRLILGVGVGPPTRRKAGETTRLGRHRSNAEKEYDAFDVPGNRGPRTDEYLEAVYAIWSQESASYDGSYISFQDLDVFPKPVQRPRPPVLIGGRSEKALRRVARYGEGWNPSQVSVAEYQTSVARLADFYEQEGRTGPDFLGINQIAVVASSDEAAHEQAYPTVARVFPSEEAYRERTLVGSPETLVGRLSEFRRAGVNWVEVRPVYATVDNLIEQMKMLASEVLPAVEEGAQDGAA